MGTAAGGHGTRVREIAPWHDAKLYLQCGACRASLRPAWGGGSRAGMTDLRLRSRLAQTSHLGGRARGPGDGWLLAGPATALAKSWGRGGRPCREGRGVWSRLSSLLADPAVTCPALALLLDPSLYLTPPPPCCTLPPLRVVPTSWVLSLGSTGGRKLA